MGEMEPWVTPQERFAIEKETISKETVTYLSVGAVGVYGDRPLQRVLGRQRPVRRWVGTLADEPTAWVAAAGAVAAHTHVVGHGVGGLLALALARDWPVRSVAVLGLGAYSGLDWRAYARQRLALPCGRWRTLAGLARLFFGMEEWLPCRALAQLLAQDLETASGTAGFDRDWGFWLPAVPVGVGGAADDPVVLPGDYRGWAARLRPGDRLWTWPQGGHFFHHHHPQVVAEELEKFWQEVAKPVNGISREWKDDASCDRCAATLAPAAEFGGFALGAPGQPSSWGHRTPAGGRVVADRRGVVAGHHLG